MPTVAVLKAELAALGEETTGKKSELEARLEAAKKRTAQDVDDDGDDDAPKSKKAKTADAPAWWWAGDKSKTVREWVKYPEAVAAALEAAHAKGASQEKAGTDYHVRLSAGSFVQCRNDNPMLQRPVVRTADGAPPSEPPPKPKHIASKSAAPPAPPPAAAAAAPPAVVGSKSVKAGGVQQVRYASTGAGSSSADGGVRTEVVKGRAAVDTSCPRADNCHVYDDGANVYDALLNQTDIGSNKNKYYIIQLLETDAQPPKYYTWNRWGRVGEERAM